MFVRVKIIKGQKYAYLVKNTWTKKGPRQKTKKYLGRIIPLKIKNESDFLEFIKSSAEEFVKMNKLHFIVSKLFEFELIKHGFEESGGKYFFNDIVAYPKTFRIINKERKSNISLKINEGYASEFLLSRIENYTIKGEEKDPHRLAEMFIIAGIKIHTEVFVELYRKISNQ